MAINTSNHTLIRPRGNSGTTPRAARASLNTSANTTSAQSTPAVTTQSMSQSAACVTPTPPLPVQPKPVQRNDSYYAPFDITNGVRPQTTRDSLNQWFERNKNPNNIRHNTAAFGPDGITKDELILIGRRADNSEDTESLDSVLSAGLLQFGFEKADLDKNGSLSVDEIFKARSVITIEQGNTMKQSKAELNNTFNLISGAVSNDGVGMTKADINKFVQNGFDNKHQTPVAALLRRNFDAFDTNKDGRMSFDEFTTARFQDGANAGKQLFNIVG
jgi:hypothetical protein